MTEIENAMSYFAKGYSCSQSVLTAFAPKIGLDEKLALKVAGGFGGGIGRLGNTCGAVSGAVMVLGLKYCPTKASDQAKKDEMYQLVRNFITEFEKLHKTTVCRDLIGYDISEPEERLKASESGAFENICPKLVQDAGEILTKML